MSEQTRYIYALKDPRDDKIRYVGCTWNPTRRLADHVRSAHRNGTPKEAWLSELGSLGLGPALVILESVEDSFAPQAEGRWIAQLSATCDLTNSTNGGDGLYSYDPFVERRTRSVQILITERLHERWERGRLRLGCKSIQDVIKLAMEKLMSEEDARLGGEG